jgi:hypothetical protein
MRNTVNDPFSWLWVPRSGMTPGLKITSQASTQELPHEIALNRYRV